jgi:LytS/YehU family sensor histidine kinase
MEKDSLWEIYLNHTTLAIATIIATIAALSAVAFTVPQQALAHYSHHHHHHQGNNIEVDQQINQANNCTLALCANQADNQVDIDRWS